MPRTERARKRRMIYTAIVSVVFVLSMGLMGLEHWGTASWWQGIAAGLALALAWHANHHTAKVLGALGLPLLVKARV